MAARLCARVWHPERSRSFRCLAYFGSSFLRFIEDKLQRRAISLERYRAPDRPLDLKASDWRRFRRCRDPDQPIPVFIHGTASNTAGSYGAFMTDEATQFMEPARLPQRPHLRVRASDPERKPDRECDPARARCHATQAYTSSRIPAEVQVGDLLCSSQSRRRTSNASTETTSANWLTRTSTTGKRSGSLLSCWPPRSFECSASRLPVPACTLLASENIDQSPFGPHGESHRPDPGLVGNFMKWSNGPPSRLSRTG